VQLDGNPVIFVVDDDISVRESVAALISDAGWTCETFPSAAEFLARPRVVAPSCLVLDVHLPDLNGLDLQELIAVERFDTPVIFITGYGDIPMTVRAMKAGAAEFLTKPFEPEALLSAIRSSLGKSSTALARESALRVLETRYASLSRREREVMALVITGQLNKQVAAKLGISEVTVKAHRGRMMRKMHAASVAQLVNIGSRLRLPVA
jgi:FixJ family two-component response regulator